MGKLKGKQIKDYVFGDCLIQFEQGSEVARAIKGGKMNLTVYGIAITLLDQKTFPIYNNQIAQNKYRIYPTYLQIVRSQHFLYMIFQQLKKPCINYKNIQQVRNFLKELQKIFFAAEQKIYPQQIFMKTNGTSQVCVIMPYTKAMQKTTNLYSKFHNKSTLAQLFCNTVPTHDRTKTIEVFVQSIDKQEFFDKIKPLVISLVPSEIPQLINYNIKPQHKPPVDKKVAKSSAKQVIQQSESQYPQFDDKQFQQLMMYVRVNPNLKKQAGNTYMRQSAQQRKDEAEKQITEIVNNVNTSIFKVTTYKNKKGKSSVEIKLNKKKLQASQFQVHFQAHYQIFKLLKDTIRAYLQKYRNGFAGIIAAYLLTLIGILRRLKMYTDLEAGIDVYQIGGSVQYMNFTKYTNIIKKQLSKQARGLVNLKNIIQNANMPLKTYEALVPFLSQDLESIDLEEVQEFCFFYMTVLMKKNLVKSRYEILFLEIMYVFINPFYSIVYSQEDVPKQWDLQYFDLKKLLISTLMPQWQI